MKKEEKSSDALLQSIGQKIRNLRLKKDLSQEEMAEIAGVHRTYIGMVERGEKNITILTLFKIAESLEIPAEIIIEGKCSGK